MFFSSDMLSKRGPLARVWLAAHVERRLSKTQLLTTSIPQSVLAILDPSTTTAVPLALRLSGQLLLGVTRIYGRKAKYLLDDCNDALLKIKMAFRTGGGVAAVDMSEEQEAAGREGINLKDRGGVLDFELMYGGGNAYDHWDLDLLTAGNEARAGLATGNARIDADIGDITLPEHEAVLDAGLDYDLDLNGFGGIDSQDYDMNLDLGLDFDLGLDSQAGANKAAKTKKRARSPTADGFNWDLGDDTLEMEVGRDAPGTADRRSARESLGSALDAFKGADADITLDSGAGGGFDGMDMDPPNWEPDNFGGGADFDMTMDLGLDMNGEGPVQVSNSREATPVPGGEPAPADNTVDVTPRTAKRIAEIPSAKKGSAAKQKKEKKQIVDAVTELDAGPRGRGLGSQANQSRQDRINKGLIVEPRYLPASREEFALREIRADPAKYFLPRLVHQDGQDYMLIAPPGICEELQHLFRYPVKPSPIKGAGKRKQDEGEDGRPEKRVRSQTVESEGVGRRREASMGANWDMQMPDQDFDMGGDMTGGDFRFDIDDVLPGQKDDAGRSKKNAWNAQREPSMDLRDGVPDLTFDMPELGDSLLSIFDEEAAATQAAEAQQETQQQTTTKWSKNTVKALKVLKKELDPTEFDEIDSEQVMSFGKVSQKASRRAASAFFFELLVLGTRDCVKLEQKEPYGDVKVEGRERLWEIIGSEGLANKEQATEA